MRFNVFGVSVRWSVGWSVSWLVGRAVGRSVTLSSAGRDKTVTSYCHIYKLVYENHAYKNVEAQISEKLGNAKNIAKPQIRKKIRTIQVLQQQGQQP